ncbi:MAG: DUF4136 domain-containing protein [Pseudomonadota bacterium]|nr:DUF4136 domain-containing protein [Pseudomonadota bacterium]
MKQFNVAILGLLLIFGVTGCSTIPVNQDYDSSANFSGIKSMQWLPTAQQTEPKASEFVKQQPLIAKRIQSAITLSLSAKGIELVDQSADAYITYHVSVQSKLRSEPFTTSFGFGTFGRRGGIVFHSAPELYEYDEGKLVIDILNLQGEVIWRGISTSLLTEQSSPQQTTELVNQVVNKVLQQYPPKTGGTTK